MNVFIDLETLPTLPTEPALAAIAETIKAPASMSKPETIADWHAGNGKYAGEKAAAIDAAYRGTALDGGKGHIFSVGFAVEFGDPQLVAWIPPEADTRAWGESLKNGPLVTVADSEGQLLEAFFDLLLPQLGKRPPHWVGHFCSSIRGGFDLPFLFQRCVIQRVQPPVDLNQWGRHGQHFFDTSTAWAGYKGVVGLKNLCDILGISHDDDIDGAEVWDRYQAGDFAAILEHNFADVARLQAVYRRLTFAD